MGRRRRKPFGVITGGGQYVTQKELDSYRVDDPNASGQIKKGEDLFAGEYGSNGLVEPPLNPSKLIALPDINTYHARACTTKSEDIAGSGWEIAPEKDGEDGGSESDKERLEDFFTNLPAPISATLRKFQYDFEVLGFAAIEMVRENRDPLGDPVGLYHVPAHTVRVHKRGDRYRQRRGRIDRWFKDVDFDLPISRHNGQATNEQQDFATELMWFQNYDPAEDYYGKPDITPALAAIYGDRGRERFNISFFDNYGIPSWAVFITGDYEEGEKQENGKTELENMVEDTLRGFQDEPHSPMVMYVPSAEGSGGSKEDGAGRVEIHFERLDTEVKDASFEVYRVANRDEIITAHGVPKRVLGIEEEGALAGNSAKEMMENYRDRILRPRREAVESVFLRYVIKGGFGIDGWRYKLKELNVKDREAERKYYTSLVTEGIITPNEAREALGFDKVTDNKGMDEFYRRGKRVTDADEPNPLQKKILELAQQRSQQPDEDDPNNPNNPNNPPPGVPPRKPEEDDQEQGAA